MVATVSSLILPPLAIILMPYFCWFFFGDLKLIKHAGYIVKAYLWGWSYVVLYLRKQQQLCLFDLTARPALVPLNEDIYVKESWPHGWHSCGGCQRCCVFEKCVFLDPKEKRCVSFRSPFWAYLNCGRYPADASEIKRYGCPKFAIKK